MKRLLTEHKLEHVTVEQAQEPPEQSPGGKYQTVIRRGVFSGVVGYRWR